ncbi:MAG: Rpp14/Pop5 family protein [Candidatus Pacearchaeota archaeon]
MNEKEKTKKLKEKKLKLLPTLREKRHYLVIKPIYETNEKELKEKIDGAIFDFIGIYGYAKAGPLYIEVKNNYAIVSVTTKWVDKVKASFIFTDLKCVGISGTIKKARRFI